MALDWDTIREGMEKGEISVSEVDDFALSAAISDDNVQMVEYLVSKGVDVNKDNGEDLNLAIRHGNFAIVKFLSENGADMSLVSKHLLYTVMMNGDWRLFNYLGKHAIAYWHLTRDSLDPISNKSVNAFLCATRECGPRFMWLCISQKDKLRTRLNLVTNMIKGDCCLEKNKPETWKDSAYYDPHLGMLVLSYVD